MAVYDPLNSDYTTQLYSTIGKKLYLNSEMADVHFVFETNDECERVPAHKAHLMAGSDVFTKMFNGSWKENKEVKIGDVSANAFREFLHFFYFGQVKLTMENVAAVMNLGEMYNVAECLGVCSKFLKNNLNDDNVCQNYGLATLFNQDDLKLSCETIIGLNAQTVFKSTGFLTCDQKMLTEIFKLNWLSCTEAELFEACMSWVKTTVEKDDLTKEHVKIHFGDLFNEIRFGSMSIEEFAALLPAYGQLFVDNEYMEIIQMITNKEFQPKLFDGNRKKRSNSDALKMKRSLSCYRLLSLYDVTEPYFIKNLETTKFSSNEPLLLKSFTMDFIGIPINGKYTKCEDIPTEITIIEMPVPYDSEKEVVKFTGKDKIPNTSYKIIPLSTPILIKPGFKYEIRLKQNPPKNCAIGAIVKSNVQMNNGINIQFHEDPKIPNDSSSTGLIYELQFFQIGK